MVRSRNDLTEYFEGIRDMEFPQIHNHTNSCCVKCGVIKKNMLRIGAIIFCFKCTKEEFKTLKPVTTERKKYLKWLKVSQKEG